MGGATGHVPLGRSKKSPQNYDCLISYLSSPMAVNFKYQRFTLSGCRDIEVRNFEFEESFCI